MPIETKNGIKNKILERVENTAAFSKENSKVKDKRITTDMIPNIYCEKELVEAFRKEAKEKKWLYTTLMNEILRERYGKGNKKMKMISFCNKKGGVGKTTLCKNIAYKLALENKKVLVIDLDSQDTITLELQQDNTDIKKTMAKIIASVEDISIDKIIQKSKYKNIDIIASSENVRKSIFLIKDLYKEKEKYLIGDLIYKINKNIFDNYDYVLIDYPPTVDELSLNYLLISDLILIPINSGIGSYKGIVDLKNTLNYITNIDKRDMPVIKLVFNNIKDNENTSNILDWLKEKKYSNYLVTTNIKNSDTFIKTENDLSSIWDSQYYWRQKQAYEELIKEII